MSLAQRSRSPTEAVVDAVARREGVDPTELDRPLYDAIDPDALDAIFRGSDGRVVFEYYDHTVSVDHDGRVRFVDD